MQETDKAYIAGLIDGEGCISMSEVKTKRSVYIRATLHISMCDRECIEWIKKTVGFGCLNKHFTPRDRKAKWRPQYHLMFACQQANILLKEIYPYLKLKQKQAKLLMELAEIRNNKKLLSLERKAQKKWGSVKLNFSRQKEILDEIHTLNKRGL